MNQKKHFITYGDGLFTHQRERLKSEASNCGLFDYIYALKKEDIQDFVSLHNYAFNNLKGAGFIWKPKIILDLLKTVGDYDIIVYCDAGCTIINGGDWKAMRDERFQFYVSLMNNSVLPISAFAGWVLTCGDINRGTRYDTDDKVPAYTNRFNFDEYVLNKFELNNNEHFLNCPAVEAGCIIVRKTQQTINFIESWLNYMVEDNYNLLINHNITDQSLLNILMYKHYAPRIDGKDFYGEGPFFAARFTDEGQKEGYYAPYV